MSAVQNHLLFHPSLSLGCVVVVSYGACCVVLTLLLMDQSALYHIAGKLVVV